MCISPIILKRQRQRTTKLDYQTDTVPCGKCPLCSRNKINAWSFRINKEIEISENPLFITLTIDDDNISNRRTKYDRSLCKSDLQLFLKRLRSKYEDICLSEWVIRNPQRKPVNRKSYNELLKELRVSIISPLKYYAVGEYGTKRGRPHYHLILLNLPVKYQKLITETWKLGFDYTLPLEEAGIKYVLKYISKDSLKTKKLPEGFQKEFSLMSKGLGKNYLTEQKTNWHLMSLDKTYATTKEGYKIPLPKYYKEKIFKDEALRKKLTIHLQKRIERNQKQEFERLKRIFPEETEKKLQIILDLKNKNATFENRKNETF